MYPDPAVLLLRVVIGGVVTMHGLLKLGLVGKGGSPAGVAGWFNSMGLRPGMFWGTSPSSRRLAEDCSRCSDLVDRSVRALSPETSSS